ncbi:MAG: hypothetical protein OXF11_03130 [Deltaproteobacteria bacterium]|nr:hypothetical protein [Deltaproteobacteria bacterium]
MGQWGFVFLAYGTVWGAVLLYVVLLKRRIRKTAAMEIPRTGKEAHGHEA